MEIAMWKRRLSVILGLCVPFSLIVPSSAQEPPRRSPESTRSSPKDTTPYARPAVTGDMVGPPPGSDRSDALNVIRVVNTVVNNTDPNLKNIDTFNDGETTIAINRANPNELVLAAY